MSAINLYRLAADLEAHTGRHPTLTDVMNAATDLATMGTHHVLGGDGTRIILPREHYEAAPDDPGELDVKPARTFPAPDVLMYGVLIFIAAFASAYYLLDGNTFAASWFGVIGVLILGWAAVCMAWDRDA